MSTILFRSSFRAGSPAFLRMTTCETLSGAQNELYVEKIIVLRHLKTLGVIILWTAVIVSCLSMFWRYKNILLQLVPSATIDHNSCHVNDHEIKSCLSHDIELHESSSCRFFTIIMDAGSTGTRMHVFEFSRDVNKSASPFKLHREVLFDEVKPGLSSFARNPKKAAESVLYMLDKAKQNIPESFWNATPIALMATAGLRLLHSDVTNAILSEIKQVFTSYPFLTNEDSVSLMDGEDEGIYAWFTLNLLLDRLHSIEPNDSPTQAIMDLGGGSTQITFEPPAVSFTKIPRKYRKEVTVFGKTFSLYSYSYLGNGLLTARLSSLKLSNKAKSGSSKSVYYTACLPDGYSTRWEFSGVEHSVEGMNYNYEQCVNEVRRFVDASSIHVPLELPEQEVRLISYFFDRGFQAGITGFSGNAVPIEAFQQAAEKACVRMSFGPEHWRPWQCFDLTYIHMLLTRAYGLSSDKIIHLTKKLNNSESSWGLGAAYHLLNTYHERSIQEPDQHWISYLPFSKFYNWLCSNVNQCATVFLSLFDLLLQ